MKRATSAYWGAVLLAVASGGCTDPGSRATNDASTGTTSDLTGSRGTTRSPTATDSSIGTGTSTVTRTSTSATTGSVDTATSGTSATSSGTGSEASQPVVVAVGYGGMRVRSLDDGRSWSDYTQLAVDGGDDENLLRGVAYGAGRFVAVGHRLFSSPNGVQWTEHDNPTPQWYGAVQYGNGLFLAVGGGGYCARSSDAMTWETCTDATDDAGFTHVRSTLFHDGLFYTADANGVLRTSPDGETWTVVDAQFGSPWAALVAGAIVPAPQTAPAELPAGRFRGSNGRIERAEPGSERFTAVFDIPDGNAVFQAHRFAFAEGEVPLP